MSNTNNEERIDPISIKFRGEEYTLDFDRASAEFAQRRGYDDDKLFTQSTIMIPELFFCAFRKHHRRISKADTDKLMGQMFPDGIPSKVIGRLRELYLDAAYKGYISTADEDNEKNAEVEIEM